MSALYCPECPPDVDSHLLPQRIASHIEVLRQDRIREFATTFYVRERTAERTPLEQHVDELLASLSDLHRLEQLAAYVAHGGQLNVDADRMLANEHEATFNRLLEQATEEQQAQPRRLSLLPATSDTLA